MRNAECGMRNVASRCVILLSALCALYSAFRIPHSAFGAALPPKITERVYFAAYGWSRGEPFRNPGGVFFYPRRNEIYVADTGNHQIVVFDAVGTPITRIRHYVESKASGESSEGEPKQVAVNSRGDIFVVDSLAAYLDVVNWRGRSIGRIYPADLLGMDRGKVGCTAVAVDGRDNVYLGTGGDECAVLVLDQKTLNAALAGRPLGRGLPLGRDLKSLPSGGIRKIGGKGQGEGKFQWITGIWVDAAGKIYVTDGRNEPMVQVFSPEGSVLLGFGAHRDDPFNFSLPAGIVTDDLGNMYVLDSLRHVFAVFTPKGQWITRLGGKGSNLGGLTFPSGIAGDGKRTIFTVEKAGARLQGFKIEIEVGGQKSEVRLRTSDLGLLTSF